MSQVHPAVHRLAPAPSEPDGTARPVVATDPVEEMLFERWYDIDKHHAREILARVGSLSDEELWQRPHLMTGAVIASDLVSSRAHPAGGDRAEILEHLRHLGSAATARGGADDGPRSSHWVVMSMIGARWEGRFDEALRLCDELEQVERHGSIRQSIFRDPRHEGDRPGYVALQRGLTMLLAGRTDTAMQLFTAAYRDGGEPPFRHFARVNAAANAAMLSAIDGHDETARKWLSRVGDVDALPAWCRDLLTVGATIGSTLLATDAGDVESAEPHAARLSQAGDRLELWPHQLYALTQYDLARHDPVTAYQRFRQIGFERGINIAVEPIADHIVFRAYLDTLVAAGEGGLVVRLAKDLGHPLRSLVPLARTHLMAGDDIAAARVAARAMRRVLMPIRDVWEATIVHAIARMRLGETESARRSLHLVLAGRPAVLPTVLARQRRQDVEDLYALAGLEYVTDSSRTEPAAIEVASLTERERTVLQHLVDGLNAAQIAKADFTSENTVKTHIKRIYRKLGASNRAQAVALANQQGVVHWHHTDGSADIPV
ncbi:response regulator transcription factor [Microbacterium esteraromaticum]|uniref:helix-turn-helix transcriptional regulator n=1 Tax=Microbacterium esteraromaticum TaxID=57043 RepID=UPI003C2CB0F5